MSQLPTFRHYGKFQREEVVVLGYNKTMNDVIIARVTGLPVDDQMHLRQIASSTHAQTQDYLIPVLQGERHASGTDWWTYLYSRLVRNDKTVIRAPFKDITDMNPDQRALFGGYGKPAQPEPDAPPLGSPEHNEAAQQALVDVPETAPVPMTPAHPPAGALPDLAAAIASLADSQAKMAESLEKLTAKVKPAPRKRPAAKKRAPVRRKAAAKAPEPEVVGDILPSDDDSAVVAEG